MTQKELKERFKRFAIAIIRFAKELSDSFEFRAIKNQIVRSGTSPAANYRAACRARSTADFIAKLKIVEEELDETQFWLEMIVELAPEKREKAANLWKEADELLAITVKSIKTSRAKK